MLKWNLLLRYHVLSRIQLAQGLSGVQFLIGLAVECLWRERRQRHGLLLGQIVRLFGGSSSGFALIVGDRGWP